MSLHAVGRVHVRSGRPCRTLERAKGRVQRRSLGLEADDILLRLLLLLCVSAIHRSECRAFASSYKRDASLASPGRRHRVLNRGCHLTVQPEGLRDRAVLHPADLPRVNKRRRGQRVDEVCGELWRVVARAWGAGYGAKGYAPVGSEELEELNAPEELDEPEELEANCATSPASMGSRDEATGRAPLGKLIRIGSAAKSFMAAGEAASRLCELCWGLASGCSGLGRLACSASRGLPTP
eukprot:scaffold10248_cov65-Phaeocystis_antarctica.AAC.3